MDVTLPLPRHPIRERERGCTCTHAQACTSILSSPPVSLPLPLPPSPPPSLPLHPRQREGGRERGMYTIYIQHPPPTTLHKTMLNAKLVSSTRVRLMLLSPPPSPPLRGREERAAAERWRHVPQGVLSPLSPSPLTHAQEAERGEIPPPLSPPPPRAKRGKKKRGHPTDQRHS